MFINYALILLYSYVIGIKFIKIILTLRLLHTEFESCTCASKATFCENSDWQFRFSLDNAFANELLLIFNFSHTAKYQAFH